MMRNVNALHVMHLFQCDDNDEYLFDLNNLIQASVIAHTFCKCIQ